MKKLIIFDCDGTLVDSQANIIAAMNDAFERNQLSLPDPHAVRRIVGLSLVEGLQMLLPEAEYDFQVHMAEEYKNGFHRLRNGGLVDEPLYPGTREIIEQLLQDGHQLGVATGKSDRGLNIVLTHHGLLNHFTTLQTADRHPSKPHPSMIYQAMADAGVEAHETIMIGDTTFDIEMAVNAGVQAIGVDWGYHDGHELLSAGARYVLKDFAELASLVSFSDNLVQIADQD
jgi:phosphoglycolate phosphatase